MTGEKFLGLSKIYWVLISGILISHGIAGILTWYAVTYLAVKECNPFMSGWFGIYGIALVLIFSEILLFALLYGVSLWYQRNNSIKTMIITFGIFNILSGLDALNDIFAISHHPFQIYTWGFFNMVYSFMGNPFVC